jgi:predicted nucleic acid-binding Zn ribbon protein
MESLQSTQTRALRALLDQQPTTPAKMAFVWKMAAGPAMARATAVRWRDGGVLVVRASSPSWLREIRRARPLLVARMRELAGADAVSKLEIE